MVWVGTYRLPAPLAGNHYVTTICLIAINNNTKKGKTKQFGPLLGASPLDVAVVPPFFPPQTAFREHTVRARTTPPPTPPPHGQPSARPSPRHHLASPHHHRHRPFSAHSPSADDDYQHSSALFASVGRGTASPGVPRARF